MAQRDTDTDKNTHGHRNKMDRTYVAVAHQKMSVYKYHGELMPSEYQRL